MAKIKFTVDEVPETLKDFYEKAEDGKSWQLNLDGDSPKLAEFRNRNIELMKQASADKAKYEGIDPDAARAALAATTDAVKLAAELDAEKSAHRGTQLKHVVTTEFLRSGGRPNAVDHIATEAAKVFAVDDAGALTTKEFSAANPAQQLSLTEWLEKQQKVADYLFLPSSGGGARGSATPARFGARSSQKVLKNPTANQLGEYAADIASGKLKVEHS